MAAVVANTIGDLLQRHYDHHTIDLMKNLSMDGFGDQAPGFAGPASTAAYLDERNQHMADMGKVAKPAEAGGCVEWNSAKEEFTDFGDGWAMIKDSNKRHYVFHLAPPKEEVTLAVLGRRLYGGPTVQHIDYCGAGIGDRNGWKCAKCGESPSEGTNMLLTLAVVQFFGKRDEDD